MLENINLSPNFKLWELTTTNRKEFQELNRNLVVDEVSKLKALAELLEKAREVLKAPLVVTSGYRCPELNKAVGSSERSQHLKCEAADFIPKGWEIGDAFRVLWKEVEHKNLNVGQIIFETANRSYGSTSWIHISLGAPYRGEERCNQILRMTEGKYEMLVQLPWNKVA